MLQCEKGRGLLRKLLDSAVGLNADTRLKCVMDAGQEALASVLPCQSGLLDMVGSGENETIDALSQYCKKNQYNILSLAVHFYCSAFLFTFEIVVI